MANLSKSSRLKTNCEYGACARTDIAMPEEAANDAYVDANEVLESDHEALDLSVIIPVYNEQERIAATLYNVKDYLESTDLKFEIVVVDDGSNDMTAEIVKFVDIYGSEFKSQQTGQLEENVKNVGKGYSIAKGMMRAKGDIVLFSDADGATPITELTKLIEQINSGFDVVVGSRQHPESQVTGRTWLRRVLSKGFNYIATTMGLLSVRDSQCGFKAYRREAARKVAALQQTNGFCFDVEQLYIAKKLGLEIGEIPVSWHHHEGSSLSLFSDSIAMFCDLIKIRFIHRHLTVTGDSH